MIARKWIKFYDRLVSNNNKKGEKSYIRDIKILCENLLESDIVITPSKSTQLFFDYLNLLSAADNKRLWILYKLDEAKRKEYKKNYIVLYRPQINFPNGNKGMKDWYIYLSSDYTHFCILTCTEKPCC